MHPVLQVVIGVVVLAVGVSLVVFLVQARRTAASVEKLAESAKVDIGRVVEDVHQVRLQIEELSAQAKKTLDLPSALGQAASSLVETLPKLFRRSEPAWMSTVGSLFQILLPLFRKG